MIVRAASATRECEIIYLINDVHYYLKDWAPTPNSTVYTSGGTFPKIPGLYQLPGGDGTVRVHYTETESDIMMTTNGSGRPYRHPNVILQGPTTVVDFGWYKGF